MRIEIGRKVEKFIKQRLSRLSMKQNNFTIISNNCWGTFIYKKYGLPYHSPFINMYIFAPDYIELLENFSPSILDNITFIQHSDSKYKEFLTYRNKENVNYPIGLLNNKYEVHFLHYTSNVEAKEKWEKRLKRINYNKLIFKFSDANQFKDEMASRFDKLKFKNKLCFTAKEYKKLKSTIPLQKFKNAQFVDDEWKHASQEFNITNFLNNLK